MFTVIHINVYCVEWIILPPTPPLLFLRGGMLNFFFSLWDNCQKASEPAVQTHFGREKHFVVLNMQIINNHTKFRLNWITHLENTISSFTFLSLTDYHWSWEIKLKALLKKKKKSFPKIQIFSQGKNGLFPLNFRMNSENGNRFFSFSHKTAREAQHKLLPLLFFS